MCLELQNVVKTYRQRHMKSEPLNVLDGVCLRIPKGSRIGITGASGAGKTTLGLILAGIVPPDRGNVIFKETDLWASGKSRRRILCRALQMVFQHPETTFDPRWTLMESLSEPYRLNGVRPDLATLTNVLNDVELDASVLPRRPRQLSGGELQRLAIARIMALNPSVIVLDEPTAMLDVITQARVMTLLGKIQQRTGVSLVLISHDYDLVHAFSSAVYHLEHGRLTGGQGESGQTDTGCMTNISH